jgi:hypothetical protein
VRCTIANLQGHENDLTPADGARARQPARALVAPPVPPCSR